MVITHEQNIVELFYSDRKELFYFDSIFSLKEKKNLFIEREKIHGLKDLKGIINPNVWNLSGS